MSTLPNRTTFMRKRIRRAKFHTQSGLVSYISFMSQRWRPEVFPTSPTFGGAGVDQKCSGNFVKTQKGCVIILSDHVLLSNGSYSYGRVVLDQVSQFSNSFVSLTKQAEGKVWYRRSVSTDTPDPSAIISRCIPSYRCFPCIPTVAS